MAKTGAASIKKAVDDVHSLMEADDPAVGKRLRSLMNEQRYSYEEALRITKSADWREIEEMFARYRAAREIVGNKKSKEWRAIEGLSIDNALTIWKFLPDTLARPGRPKGKGPVTEDEALLTEMDALVRNGIRKTTAAKTLLKQRGFKAGIKGRADSLVRIWNKRQ